MTGDVGVGVGVAAMSVIYMCMAYWGVVEQSIRLLCWCAAIRVDSFAARMQGA